MSHRLKVAALMALFLILAVVIIYALVILMRASDAANYVIFVNSGWVSHPEIER